MSNRAIIEKELTQGVVPIGTPKAYQYDQALVESAKAEVRQGLTEANTILTAIRNEYGYPFTASSADAMTDQTKIYVYTGTTTASLTQGHWYYYDGNGWVDGGAYNAIAFETDTTLSISGAAADAKITGQVQNGNLILEKAVKAINTDFIDSVYQFADNENKTYHEIWWYTAGDAAPHVISNESYNFYRIPEIYLPAGTYTIPVMTIGSQSYIKDSSGVTTFYDKFGAYGGDFTLTENSILYITANQSWGYAVVVNKNSFITFTIQNLSTYASKGTHYAKLKNVDVEMSSVNNLDTTVTKIQDGTIIEEDSIKPLHASFIDSVYQFLDNDNNTEYEIWDYTSGDEPVPHSTPTQHYARVPKLTLPPGQYTFPVLQILTAQSWVKDSEGVQSFGSKFSVSGQFNGDFTITETTTFYISVGVSFQVACLVNKNSLITFTTQNIFGYTSKGTYYAKLKNVRVPSTLVDGILTDDTTIYDQAFIKNGELTCNNDHLNANTSLAKYTEVDMGSNVTKVMCRGKFRSFGSNCSITLITTPLNTRMNVQNIVQKSIHIGFNGSGCFVETFLSQAKTTHATYSYTINLNTEVDFGWSISGNTLTIYLPDETTQTVTDSAFSASNGQYFIFEHFSYQTTATDPVTDEFGQPVITGVYAECDSGLPLRDNFKRPFGLPLVAPTGHVYRQFRSTDADGNDTVYDNNGGQ